MKALLFSQRTRLERTGCKHRLHGKFSTHKPTDSFKCKLCDKKKDSAKRVHKIVFGRRRWYDICQDCIPKWIIYKRE